MLFRGQMLVVKENDLMVEQCLADLANDLLGERPGEIDASDFGAERARDPHRAALRHLAGQRRYGRLPVRVIEEWQAAKAAAR
jgi:hypothetical protein